MVDAEALVRERLKEHRALADLLLGSETASAVAAVGTLLVDAFRAGGKLLIFGNGGSASDAQHIAAEFLGRCTRERRALPALSLSDGAAAVTAIANDYGYEHLFARQLDALAAPGDVAMGLSTSGRSVNVLRGLERAGELGAVTVALSGADDELMRSAAQVCLAVPSTTPQRVQETHLLWGHTWAELVEHSIG